MAGVANVDAVSLAISYLSIASVPHSVANSMKNLLAAAAEMLQEFLADPNKFAAAVPAAAAAPAVAAKEESEEEVDDDMGFGLFD